MAHLTCIGGHGVVGANDGGTGARGYWIFRRGALVIIRYGLVRTCRGRNVWIEWLHWREVRKPCRSAEAARQLIRELIREKTRPGHGYTRLGPGVRIW